MRASLPITQDESGAAIANGPMKAALQRVAAAHGETLRSFLSSSSGSTGLHVQPDTIALKLMEASCLGVAGDHL